MKNKISKKEQLSLLKDVLTAAAWEYEKLVIARDEKDLHDLEQTLDN